MPSVRNTRLPDPDAARRVISEAVPEFGPRIAAQAGEHATALRPFLERRRAGSRDAAALMCDIYRWSLEMDYLLSPFMFDGAPRSALQDEILDIVLPIDNAMRTPNRRYVTPDRQYVMTWPPRPGDPSQEYRAALMYRWLSAASVREWSPLLAKLHEGLVRVANSRSVPRLVLPAQHPPKFARLHEAVVAETVADQLAKLIDEIVKQYEAVGDRKWPGQTRGFPPSYRIESPLLHWFLTAEVVWRYRWATWGLAGAECLAQEVPDGGIPLLHSPDSGRTGGAMLRRAYQKLTAGLAPRIHSAYIAVAVNYLAEVLDLMPEYAEASGQGKRRDPVTVYGNVGAINSEVHNSHLAVADTLTTIGATIQSVADRGEPGIAEAIRALSEAVQQAPEIAEDQRAELLHHVADVADAAAAPDEPRRLTRAKAAIAMITTAAGASTKLAQAVDTWQQAAGHLF
ncbi:hypothetical protein [Catenulispora rubra]|uniref:hypothetical protein n=1 Tax=Catenulispora rubra TaxID=280293 RepID=UPI00189207E7|nr:hypothetical protein [Catenulispora rubra]